jgi:hypothetical protein
MTLWWPIVVAAVLASGLAQPPAHGPRAAGAGLEPPRLTSGQRIAHVALRRLGP